MRLLQKLILPILLIITAFIIYATYFSQEKTLGSFSSFDPNNNSNKNIRVSIVREKGINTDEAAGTVSFFGRDAQGVEYPVQAPLPLPADFDKSASVLLKGHLHKDHFHAVELIGK